MRNNRKRAEPICSALLTILSLHQTGRDIPPADGTAGGSGLTKTPQFEKNGWLGPPASWTKELRKLIGGEILDSELPLGRAASSKTLTWIFAAPTCMFVDLSRFLGLPTVNLPVEGIVLH